VAVVALGPLARAAIQQVNSVSPVSQTAFPASSGDLIQVGAVTLASAEHSDFEPFTYNGTTSTAALNDGMLGQNSINTDTAFDFDGEWTSTYYLNTAASPDGYVITEIRSMAGWIAQRASQRYERRMRQAGQGLFTAYGTFELLYDADGSTMITLTDSTGALASGIDAVQFVFRVPQIQGYPESVIRELDVFGYGVAIPEPASLGLLVACTLLVRRRWRCCANTSPAWAAHAGRGRASGAAIVCALLVATVAPGPLGLRAAPFANGTFELPDVNTYTAYTPGAGPSAWTYGMVPTSPRGGVLWDNASGVSPAPEGQQLASLNDSSGLGSITQQFDTLVGGTYTCTFLLSGIADGTADTFGVDVQASGSAPQSFTFNTGGAPNLNVPTASLQTYSFTAASALTALSFASTALSPSGMNYGPVIDDVQVSGPPPLPPTLVQANSTSIASELAFPASADDLIDVSAVTFDSAVHTGYAAFGGSSADRINDGSLGTATQVSTTAFDLDGQWTSTYYLNTAAAPDGYVITEIRSMAGWPGPRASQKFELRMRAAGQPYFANYGVFNLTYDANGSSMIALTDSTGIIASGIDAMQFTFMKPDGPSGNEAVIREVDVFGYRYTVPEPAAFGLILSGTLLVWRRRR